MKCLVCSASITHARLGINCCRACAAFYQRSIGLLGSLKCAASKQKCQQKNRKGCRKCRLDRFREILAQAREDSPEVEIPSVDTVKSLSPREETRSFIDHRSFYECESSTTHMPLLHKIRRGYSFMCLIRKTGEMGFRSFGGEERDFKSDDLIFTPVPYSSIIPNTRIASAALMDFINFTFEEFRLLDHSGKELFLGQRYLLMNLLESAYRAAHHFPGDFDISLVGYTTYFRNDDMEKLLDNCPDDIDKAKLTRELKITMDEAWKGVRQLYESTKPTDFEFLALLGLALWSDGNASVNESINQIGSRMRTEILRELHVYYTMKGTSDYASRVGNLFCLLVNCQNQASKTHEDFQVFRLLNFCNSSFPDV